MAVPDFQTIMLPLLVYLGDGAEHSLAEVIEVLGDRMGLSPEDKKELLPSESDVKFDNRVRWAAFYLRKAELVERTGRGRIRAHRVPRTPTPVAPPSGATDRPVVS